MASVLASLKPQHDVLAETERLLLRPVRTDDIAAIHAMRLNPKVMEFMPGVETELDALKSYTVKRMELMMKENMFSFAIQLRHPVAEEDSTLHENSNSAPVIGFIGVTRPPEIFYIFDEKYWGKGYATEALRVFLETYWSKNPNGLSGVEEEFRDYLEADVAIGNAASEGVVKKCGFVYVRDGVMTGNGREVPTKTFRLSRPVSG